MTRKFAVGDRFVHARTFTPDDVRAFTAASGDAGIHHVEPDAEGRVLVQGLLTATIPTKIGGDLDYIAREMHFELVRPVYTNDTIRCEITVDEVESMLDRVRLAMTGLCTNQHGEPVMKFATRGVVRVP